MIVDGKTIAIEILGEIRETLKVRQTHPCLAIFACAPNPETRKYLELKKKRAAEAGVDIALLELDKSVTTKDAEEAILATAGKCEGIIVQLPFPPQVDINKLLSSIPPELDVDRMHYEGEETNILPPVVGAIKEIATKYKIDFAHKKVVVVGRGKLVGKPAALWAMAQSAAVTVIDKDTKDADSILREADIIISGAGHPGLITPDKIKDGVAIFDAGTSEDGGVLRGDAELACSEKAVLFTPVPGGIGPITIAILLRNLVDLSK